MASLAVVEFRREHEVWCEVNVILDREARASRWYFIGSVKLWKLLGLA